MIVSILYSLLAVWGIALIVGVFAAAYFLMMFVAATGECSRELVVTLLVLLAIGVTSIGVIVGIHSAPSGSVLDAPEGGSDGR